MTTSIGKVREFCVQRLANDLFDNLLANCSGQERADLDWRAAEDFVNENPKVHESIFATMVYCDIDLNYDQFVRLFGTTVWDRLYQAFIRNFFYLLRYAHVSFH